MTYNQTRKQYVDERKSSATTSIKRKRVIAIESVASCPLKRKIKCKEENTLYPQRERILRQVVEDLRDPDLQKEAPEG